MGTKENGIAVNGTDDKKSLKSGVLFWSNLYKRAPKIYVPFTNFDIGFSIISWCLICLLRLLNEYIFVNILEFDPTTYKTIESASAMTSLTHAIVLCTGLWSVLTSQPYVPSARLDSAPEEYQMAVTALLQLCTGYMFYDGTFMCRSNGWSIHPEDVAFFGHHLVTIMYMSQCRVLGYGHISAMGLMFTGELTNPFQNGHLITKFGIQLASSGSFFHTIHPYVEYIFAITYFIVRAFVGPTQIAHITYHFLFTKQGRTVPFIVSIFWILMIWGIILGSIPWTKECLTMIQDGLKVKYDESWDYGPRYEL